MKRRRCMGPAFSTTAQPPPVGTTIAFESAMKAPQSITMTLGAVGEMKATRGNIRWMGGAIATAFLFFVACCYCGNGVAATPISPAFLHMSSPTYGTITGGNPGCAGGGNGGLGRRRRGGPLVPSNGLAVVVGGSITGTSTSLGQTVGRGRTAQEAGRSRGSVLVLARWKIFSHFRRRNRGGFDFDKVGGDRTRHHRRVISLEASLSVSVASLTSPFSSAGDDDAGGINGEEGAGEGEGAMGGVNGAFVDAEIIPSADDPPPPAQDDYTPTSTTLLTNYSIPAPTDGGGDGCGDHDTIGGGREYYTHEYHEVDYDLENNDLGGDGGGHDDDGVSLEDVDPNGEGWDAEGKRSRRDRPNLNGSRLRGAPSDVASSVGATGSSWQYGAKADAAAKDSSPKTSSSAARFAWLNETTEFVLRDVPVGQLTPYDVITIQKLMGSWVQQARRWQRRSSHQSSSSSHAVDARDGGVGGGAIRAAKTVERLLKRVLDDYHAGNGCCTVTTRMYTMVIQSWANSGTRGASQRARHILDHMLSLYKITGDPNIQPDVYCFNAVLNALAKSGERGAAMRAERVLATMEELYEGGGYDGVKPGTVSYTLVIDAWSKEVILATGGGGGNYRSTRKGDGGGGSAPYSSVETQRRATERVLDILDIMEERYAAGDDGVRPNVFSYSAAINCLAKVREPRDAPQIAEDLLHKMIELSQKPGREDVAPNVVTYNAVIHAWSRSHHRDAAERAERVLKRMEEQDAEAKGRDAPRDDGVGGGSHPGPPVVRPDVTSYNSVIYTWTRRCHRDALLRADAVLRRLEARTDDVRPNAKSYNTLLVAWSKIGDRDGARNALALLRRMQRPQQHQEEEEIARRGGGVRPDAISYNAVMHAFARSREKGAAKRAERVFSDMYDRYKAGDERLKPTVRSFAAILDAWAKSPPSSSEKGGGGDGGMAARRSEDILRHMEELSQEGLDVMPDIYCYTIVISCWANSGEPGAAARATQILEHIESMYRAGNRRIKPTVRSYNAAIDAWSKSHDPDAAEQGERLLNRMIDMYESGDKDVTPETFSFNAVINSWSRSSHPDAGRRMDILLDRMRRMHDKGNMACEPDARTYSSLIFYWTRNRRKPSPHKADEILRDMILRAESGRSASTPTLQCFTLVIESWARSGEAEAGEKAEAILNLMLDLYDSGVTTVKPTAFCYKGVLEAYAHADKTDSALHSHRILLRMEELYESGAIDVKPSPYDYIVCLNTWAKSKLPRKAFYAQKILHNLVGRSEPGNDYADAIVHAHSIVINACAFASFDAEEQREAYKIARETLRELCDSPFGSPNSVTFGTYLKACGKLRLGSDHSVREEDVRSAFSDCCRLGKVDGFVASQLRYAASRKLFEELLGQTPDVDIDTLPSNWTRSVEKWRPDHR